MATWTLDVFQAKSIQGPHASGRGTTCNPRVIVEYAGERIGVTSQQTNTRDPVWNDTIRGDTKEGLARRTPLTFKIVHKPEWAAADRTTTVSYARVLISSENSREFRRKLMLRSEVTHEDNGGYIEVGWHAVERRDDEEKAKEAMLSQMRTSPQARPIQPSGGVSPSQRNSSSPMKKWSVGDKVLYREDDFSQWKTGFVQEIAPDGTPKLKVEKAQGDSKSPQNKDGVAKPEPGDGKGKDDPPDKAKPSSDTTKDAEKKPGEKDEAKGGADDPTSPKAKAGPGKAASVIPPNQGYALNHLIQAGVLGTLPDQLDTELSNLMKRKEHAVASEQYREAQALKEQIEVYKQVKERSRTGWRSEAPVSRLVKASRRIDFESGKCIEAGTLGEVIGGLVRMGSALFTPTPGDVESYLGGGAVHPSLSPGLQPHPTPSLPAVEHPVHHGMLATQKPAVVQRFETDLPLGIAPSPVHRHQPLPSPGSHEGLSIVVVPSHDPSVEVWVKNLSPSDTVSTLKARVQAVNGLPAAHQCLTAQMPDGRRVKLEDGRTLAAYGLQSGDMVWASRSTGLIHLQLVVNGSHRIRISLPGNATALMLKQRVAERENIPVSTQCLEMDGHPLADSKTLSSQGVGQDTPLSVYARPAGPVGGVAPVFPHGSPHAVHHRAHAAPASAVLHLTVVDTTASPPRTLTVDCREEETVSSVRQRLHRYGGLPLQGVALAYEGEVLSDAFSLAEYRVAHGAALELVWCEQRSGGGGGVHSGSYSRPVSPQSTDEVAELKSQVSELVSAVKVLAGGVPAQQQQASSPLQEGMSPLHPRSPRTAELLNLSKALRVSAEDDIYRVTSQLGSALDEPLPARRPVRSPPRGRVAFDVGGDPTSIVNTDRFRQMRRVAAERE